MKLIKIMWRLSLAFVAAGDGGPAIMEVGNPLPQPLGLERNVLCEDIRDLLTLLKRDEPCYKEVENFIRLTKDTQIIEGKQTYLSKVSSNTKCIVFYA